MHDRSMDLLRLPRFPRVQQTPRVLLGQLASPALCSSKRHGRQNAIHSGGAPATNARAAALEKSHVTTSG